MRKYIRVSITGALLVATLVAPFAVSALTADQIQAQINALLAQVASLQARIVELQQQASSTPPTVPPGINNFRLRICSLLARNLRQGVEGDDVRSLQEFLRAEGFFNQEATGFFGLLTRDAVRRWQAARGIASNGDENSTGWGLIGPRTRAIIARWCGGNPFPPVATTTPVFILLGSTSTTPGNQPPAISSFLGPATLTVDQAGTWVAGASDPEGGPLTYNVTWGEEGATSDELLALADLLDFASTTTFTHAYDEADLYTVTLRVKDNAGGVSAAGTRVRVGEDLVRGPWDWFGGGTACTMEYAPVCGKPQIGITQSFPSTILYGPEQTYSNRCMMNVANATLLHEGVCTAGSEQNVPDVTGLIDSGLEPEGGSCQNTQVLYSGKCYWREASSATCWFNNQVISNGSSISAYEKQFVAGYMYNDICRMETRICQNGKLTGSYKYPTCSSSTDW